MSASEIPHMTYRQYRTARRLVRECCNYDCGNCLLLDNGEECVCPQSITYSLICKWFRAAVLPLDAGLCAALFPLSDGGVAGSVEGHLPRPSTTPFTAPPVPQNVPNGASGPGQRKTGLMRRKSTL